MSQLAAAYRAAGVCTHRVCCCGAQRHQSFFPFAVSISALLQAENGFSNPLPPAIEAGVAGNNDEDDDDAEEEAVTAQDLEQGGNQV